MANRVKARIGGLFALVMVLGLIGAGMLMAQSSVTPPANPLPAPLVAGWQPNTGRSRLCCDTGSGEGQYTGHIAGL